MNTSTDFDFDFNPLLKLIIKALKIIIKCAKDYCYFFNYYDFDYLDFVKYIYRIDIKSSSIKVYINGHIYVYTIKLVIIDKSYIMYNICNHIAKKNRSHNIEGEFIKSIHEQIKLLYNKCNWDYKFYYILLNFTDNIVIKKVDCFCYDINDDFYDDLNSEDEDDDDLNSEDEDDDDLDNDNCYCVEYQVEENCNIYMPNIYCINI